MELDDASFLRPLRRNRLLPPGTVIDDPIQVPQSTAQKLVRSIIHLVADIPAGSTPELVWQQGRAELLVHSDSIRVACTSGLVRIGLDVECDQLPERTRIVVPIGVGSRATPAGLVMSTFARVDGPAVVADSWSDALSAFAWEALVELARKLCAELGRDERRRPLIPVEIGAGSRVLLVTAMARHDVSIRSLR